MNSTWLWNLHQRHKPLKAEAFRDILKIRVSEMVFPGVFKRCFQPQMPYCFARIHETLATMPLKCPRHSKTRAVNPLRLQILRIDGEGMINDVIMHTAHDVIGEKKNVQKRCCWNCYIGPNWLTSHTGVCEEMFDVNSRIAQTMQSI